MKNGKNPTLRQKLFIKDAGLNPTNWFVTKHLPSALHLVHRHTSTEKIIAI
ncbi:DUF6906 family protein [Paenibacillus pinisoli]|uniref:DUF6906 family protein n=1 Tax=Paenibacillus pinisoli TaxID=1276110 RepID=UPI003C74BD56